MKVVSKSLERSLTKPENMAIERVAEILEAAFGKRMFKATVNADVDNKGEVFGVSFAFDMRTN